MTDQELQQLAQQYAEDMCPIEDYTKGDYIDLEARNTELQIHRDDAMQVLRWITKTHCIVSREKVQKHHKDYAFLSRKHPKASERHLSEIIIKEIEDLFGKELFEERSDK